MADAQAQIPSPAAPRRRWPWALALGLAALCLAGLAAYQASPAVRLTTDQLLAAHVPARTAEAAFDDPPVCLEIALYGTGHHGKFDRWLTVTAPAGFAGTWSATGGPPASPASTSPESAACSSTAPAATPIW